MAANRWRLEGQLALVTGASAGIGLAITRELLGFGADVLMVPAAFTAFTGKDHWQVLLQARAIENTAYVVAPAQTGLHYGRRRLPALADHFD